LGSHETAEPDRSSALGGWVPWFNDANSLAGPSALVGQHHALRTQGPRPKRRSLLWPSPRCTRFARPCLPDPPEQPGSARTRHPLRRSGEGTGVVISSRHAETATSPRGGDQGGEAYLAPHPSARRGYTRAARRSADQHVDKTTRRVPGGFDRTARHELHSYPARVGAVRGRVTCMVVPAPGGLCSER
jgi:hypothetical protein